MKTYLLSAAGVIFLTVITSMLVPDGKLKKSIVFVFRMACILVLVQPVTEVFKISKTTSVEPMYDYEYICKVYTNSQSEQLDILLQNEFSVECDCTVNIIYNDGEFKEDGVFVTLNCENEKIIDDIYAYLQELGYINITVYAKSY